MVGHTAMAHRRMPKGTRMEVHMLALTAALTAVQGGTKAIALHRLRPWCATTAGQGHTMRGSRAPASRRSTVAHAMWCMTGAATGCISPHVGTIGCNTAVITCWLQ